jgi:hypothetical protein
MRKKLFLAAAIGAMMSSGAFAQVNCGDTTPSKYVPSWGSTGIYNVDSMSNPNGAFHGMSYFFWDSSDRLQYFRSTGTTATRLDGSVYFGNNRIHDATFELRTSFKNNFPGAFYSNHPAGTWETNMASPFIRHSDVQSERHVAVGTIEAHRLVARKVYYFDYPMVGSVTEWYLPVRSAIQIDAISGKRWPADQHDKHRMAHCGITTVMPQGWVVAPVECAKWSYDGILNPPLPSGVLGGPIAHNPNIVEKRLPGLSRFGGAQKRPGVTPMRGDVFIDIFLAPGQRQSGASFAHC